MRKFLSTVVLLSLLKDASCMQATTWDDEDFFKHCPPSRCSKHGPEIRFPFRLESSNTPTSCGAPGMHLSCSGQDTILNHPYIGSCIVTAIDYHRTFLRIIPLVDSMSPCPVWKLNSTSTSKRQHPNILGDIYLSSDAILVFCSTSLVASDIEDYIAGPIQCFSNASHFSYLVSADAPMFALPLNCKSSGRITGIPNTIKTTTGKSLDGSTFGERARRILYLKETAVSWLGPTSWDANEYSYFIFSCSLCEGEGRKCGFSSQMNRTFCVRQAGSHIKVIAATSSVVTVVLLSMVAALYVSLKKRYNEEIHLKVEMFLKTYGTSKPCRYTFPQVKKIARRFKDKVGQGGSGSVYRGELLNEVPVAVKMLENSTADGDEFINEVATIGRIHHANIVRLLGFCSEGARRALIYEFLPNKSLDRYIFNGDISTTSQRLLEPNKMLDIALGIARGMEYLHQGCSQRILHFDIKPHNILLDYNLNPKISDFGLAKLCERDQSMVTLTRARGTMGYIAPELYSRNFGGISHKSDVYSFGMLVLEMVAGRRNSDPNVENQSDVYLPELVYDKVITRENPINDSGVTHQEYQTVRQLAIVSLWCIQWNPKQRPSMTKVVNMLTGRSQNLQIPPKPFFTSESHHMP